MSNESGKADPGEADPGEADPGEAHPGEAHPAPAGTGDRLNALRAAVLGANDGIVSQAGLVVGVAGATTDRDTILTAGLAGLVAGAISMALGEYVSVSSQRDAERELLAQECRELTEQPEEELDELTEIYRRKGLTPATARQVARELTAADPLAAHAEAELGIDPEDLVNPMTAGIASAVAFVVGGLLPLLAVTLTATDVRVPVTVVVTLAALGLLGLLSARAGETHPRRPVLRVMVGGSLALAITYTIGNVTGAAVG